jgi:two-component system cell cycle response regulator CtrA
VQPDLELAALRERNAWLEERVAHLERVLVPVVALPLEWRLTSSEGRLVSALYARRECSKDQLMATMYRNDGRDEPEEKIVDVFICKARAKMKPFGAGIETRWGHGYALDAAARTAILKLNGVAA